MKHKMEVSGIALDPFSNTPIVILKDSEGENMLPIWIGFMEASSIAMELEKTPRARPLTHDLVRNLLGVLKFSVIKVEVTDLRNDTFYAEIHLKRDSEEHIIDSRPSDAMAIALRTGSPIYVRNDVLEKSRNLEVNKDKDKLNDLLERIPPEDFGKYKM